MALATANPTQFNEEVPEEEALIRTARMNHPWTSRPRPVSRPKSESPPRPVRVTVRDAQGPQPARIRITDVRPRG